MRVKFQYVLTNVQLRLLLQVMKLVLEGARPSVKLIGSDTPPNYVELMTACWNHDPQTRPHFKQVSSTAAKYCRRRFDFRKNAQASCSILQ